MTDIEKKQKKEKKVMTPQRLEQLAAARKRALDIRQAGAVIKMEAKIASITKIDETEETPTPIKVTKKETNFNPTPPREIENKIIKAELIDNPVTQEYVPEYSPRVDVQPPMLGRQPDTERVWDASHDDEDEDEPAPAPVKKEPRKKERVRDASRIKTKIVIEQSSDDEDEFHPHEHVIFVKRKSKNDSKAKVVPAATPPPPTSPVREHREHIPLQPQQRQLPTFPLANTMDDFVNAGFTNYRKYY